MRHSFLNATRRTFRTAFRALSRNVTRSCLTCLGIIIGVAAVIGIIEIGKGSASRIRRTMARMGADNIIIYPGMALNNGINQGIGSIVTLHPQDCQAILRECPAIRSAVPLVKSGIQIIYGSKNWRPGNFNGTSPDYVVIHDWPMKRGEMFAESDVRSGTKVCVLGTTIVRELFDNEDPIGKTVRLNNVNFRVIGVLQSKGANVSGGDLDDVLLAPWTTIKYRINSQGSSGAVASSAVASAAAVNSLSGLYASSPVSLYPSVSSIQQADSPQNFRFTNIDQILLAAKTPAQVHLAMHQIRQVLRDRHRLFGSQPDDFNLRALTEIAHNMETVDRTHNTMLMLVAMISLIVGGVGIMNIMLVSVTERTREIGLRMAVGARSRDILLQFLTEAVLVCVAGSLVGIALGRGASYLLRRYGHTPTEISWPAIIGAVVMAGSVGIIFGFYPAWKASRLDPITALRYE